MPKNNEIKFGKYFNLPNPGLRAYFDIVRMGQPEVYRTPFGKGRSVSKILQEWLPHLQKLSDSWPTLLDFENDLAKKVGPMSVMKPLSERMPDIRHYYEDILLPQKPIDDSAVRAVISEFGVSGGIQIRDLGRTVEEMKLSTNSGNPYFTKRRNVVDKTLPCSVQKYGDTTYQYLGPNANEWRICAVLGWRGQEGGPKIEDVKQRVVWMFPFAVNILELAYYQPAILAAQNKNLVPAWVSMESVDQRITRMFDTKAPDDLVVCTDFSRFDQHFNPCMQSAAFKIIQSMLTSNERSEYWLKHIFPIKYNIPLAIQMGEVVEGAHGMGSGSGGTNYDETVVHRALQYEAAQRAGARLNPNSQCLGDDGVLTYPGITVEDVVRTYSSHGQEMNTDKQYASKLDCTYLRRWHHKHYRVDDVCVGVYATTRALGRLCMQERYYDPEVWSSKAVALRQLSILENCKYHPLKEEFVEFCMKRDKYRLGLDIPNFLDDIESVAKENMENMPDFLGYVKTLQGDADSAHGIADWWIVKYLKSMR
nr:MAG: RNA-dependent RNA polymerase [Porcine picobirnavirus]